jgi:hypothetical protein
MPSSWVPENPVERGTNHVKARNMEVQTILRMIGDQIVEWLEFRSIWILWQLPSAVRSPMLNRMMVLAVTLALAVAR